MISNDAALPADALDAAAAADNRVNVGVAAWLRQARRVRAVHGVSVAAQAWGIAYYWARLGTRRREYYLYRLYDPARPRSARLSVLSNARWEGLVDRINPRPYQYLVNDKTAFGTMLDRFGIATPTVYDVFDVRRRMFLSGQPAADAGAFVAHLRRVAGSGIVVKDEEGRQGHHVYVVRAIDDDRVELPDRHLTHEEFYVALCASRVHRFLVQERLRPHPLLRPMAGETLPTVRVVSYIDETGTPRLLRASLRIPREDSGVDNFSAGNLAAPVDLATGMLGRGLERETGRWHAMHPLTTAPIEGFVLPDWTAAVTLVTRAALVMERLPTVGWDVAITTRGPALIEGNSRYQLNVIQMPHGSGIWQGDFRRWCLTRAKGAEGRRA